MSLLGRLSPHGHPFPRDRVSRLDRAIALARRGVNRSVMSRLGRLEDLAALGRSCASLTPPTEAPKVLILALRGWPNHCALESVIAHALRVRGAEVALLTCGGGQPACEVGWARQAYPRPCDRCAWYTDRVAALAGLRSFRLSDRFEWGRDGRDAPLQPQAGRLDPSWAGEVSVPWFLKSTAPDDSARTAEVRRDFTVAAASVEAAAAAVLDDFDPDIVFMVNGLFASERVVRELALARGMRAPTYEMGPRRDTLFLSQAAPACELDTTPAWRQVADRPLSATQREAIQHLLVARRAGVGTAERYFDTQEDNPDALRDALALPGRGRILSLFANIAWDTGALGRDIGFLSMIDWVTSAVLAARQLDDATLVVRVHPGETRWGTNQDLEEAIISRVGTLPENVRLIRADQPLSSYALLVASDVAFVYTTTVGLEAANMGVPVVVAGTTHYRGLGFTWDIESPAELRTLMARGDLEMTDGQRELALRYAFTFFFRAHVPLPSVPQAPGSAIGGVPRSVSALEPGRDPYLDLICDRILDGGEFVVPDELARIDC